MLNATWSAFCSAIAGVLGDGAYSTRASDLEAASRDETHGLQPVLPHMVVWPTSTAQVQQIVRLCMQHNIPMTPRGAGTGKSGGCVPVRGGVVLAFERMNQIIAIDTANLTAVVQPGVILGDFQRAVEAKGLFYPPDPASLQWCTLGGNVAENASGPRAMKYGCTRDYVLGLTAILPTGECIQTGKSTVKGVTGYDLTALLCGSEGTLAIVTDITLRLLPLPAVVTTGVLAFTTVQAASEAVSAILAAGILPRCLEFLDKTCLEVTRQAKKGLVLPPDAQAAVIVEVDGDEASATWQVMEKIAEVAHKGLLQSTLAAHSKQREQIWNSRRATSEALKTLAKYRVSEDIVVPRDQIPHMVAFIESLGAKMQLRTCAFGHAGDGNLHAQVFYDVPDQLPVVEQYLQLLFEKTIHLGGTLTGEHGIGIAKQRFLSLEQSPELLDLQRRIKRAFDPEDLLNPGKSG